MAIDMAAVERREKILIISPSLRQSSIIMGKVIEHLFDHPLLTGMIDYSAGTLERLRQERSKTRITFKNGSEVMILTAEARIVAREGKGLMGFGATTVVVDESSLITDEMFSKVLRMVGGMEHGRLIQLGNPFEDNHFARAFGSSRYEKVSVDWKQALAEGRVTQEFLDEAKEDMPPLDWWIFYECKFPAFLAREDSVFPWEWIELAVNQKGCEGEHKQSSLDVARFGKDKTIYIFRKGGEVKRLEETEKRDTMEVVGWSSRFLEEDKPNVHCTDVVGIGSGVHDRLVELKDEEKLKMDGELVPVNVGASPVDEGMGEEMAKEQYFNLRAQVFWNLRNLFKPDGKGRSQISIPDDPELKKQLSEIRYKFSSERKRKIEAKEEMKKRLGVSPDKADALALAFFQVSGVEPEMVIV
jgi:hypothetical protein